jgi:hypothetical protein
MSRKSVWCFTVTSGLIEPTPQEGIEVKFNSQTLKLIVGPVETPDSSTDYPHQHGYIACARSCSLTKGQAIAVLKQENIYQDGQYVHELESTKAKYHSYCFKSTSSTHTSAERAIKRAFDAVQSDGGFKITPKRLKESLIHSEGATFVAKNKQVIEVALGTPSAFSRSKRDIEEDVDAKANMKKFMQACVNYRAIIEKSLANGFVTTHKAFNDTSRDDQVLAILITTLLPMVVNRKRITDTIPGLYFYGNSNCGKSYMFSQIPNYKKVACDAEGVGRFRLEGDQAAFLLDDIDPEWLFDRKNCKTMRSLVIGESDSVKTFGDTQEVRGWVVMTSNSTPRFLEVEVPNPEGLSDDKLAAAQRDFDIQCAAWKRRFLTLNFTEPVDLDDMFIDFSLNSLNIVAMQAIIKSYQKLQSEDLKTLFKTYYDYVVTMLDGEAESEAVATYNDLLVECSQNNE